MMAPPAQIHHQVQRNAAARAKRDVRHRHALPRTIERDERIRRKFVATLPDEGEKSG
jgi:hypothetical protein